MLFYGRRSSVYDSELTGVQALHTGYQSFQVLAVAPGQRGGVGGSRSLVNQ